MYAGCFCGVFVGIFCGWCFVGGWCLQVAGLVVVCELAAVCCGCCVRLVVRCYGLVVVCGRGGRGGRVPTLVLKVGEVGLKRFLGKWNCGECGAKRSEKVFLCRFGDF